MAETFDPSRLSRTKALRYGEVEAEIASVLDGEDNLVARMATAASMLATSFDHFFWTGFYVADPRRPGELVVGPYQGTLGCLRIPYGRGVCGAAALEKRTLVVDDVSAFPGHIACDPRSQSEIVVPALDRSGAVRAVLDVDAVALKAFDGVDAEHLQRIVERVFSAGS